MKIKNNRITKQLDNVWFDFIRVFYAQQFKIVNRISNKNSIWSVFCTRTNKNRWNTFFLFLKNQWIYENLSKYDHSLILCPKITVFFLVSCCLFVHSFFVSAFFLFELKLILCSDQWVWSFVCGAGSSHSALCDHFNRFCFYSVFWIQAINFHV